MFRFNDRGILYKLFSCFFIKTFDTVTTLFIVETALQITALQKLK